MARVVPKGPAPVVPDATAGYSGTPLPRKLGIRPRDQVLLLDAPVGFETRLAGLPEGARVVRRARSAGVLLLFVPSAAALEARFARATSALAPKGKLWIAWPKKAWGVVTDVTEPVVRAFGLANGFVDYKVCAIDETWSGLCFARKQPLGISAQRYF